MITVVEGDIFKSDRVLVNPVNCEGISGAGVAKDMKRRFPLMQKTYVKMCKNKELKIGHPRIVRGKRDIILFPTKDHWKNPSKLEYIEAGLKSLAVSLKEWKIKSLAMPALGCGCGRLEFGKVVELVKKYLFEFDIQIYRPKSLY